MAKHSNGNKPKTIIGVLASHDDTKKNNDLIGLFEDFWKEYRSTLEKFHFVFTGGTYQRVVLGKDTEKKESTEKRSIAPKKKTEIIAEDEELKNITDKGLYNFLLNNSTRLPDRLHGGVTILSNLIVQRQCSILWSFLSSATMHWINPENLALLRLCDIWNEKRLMNRGSVDTWFRKEADTDADRNPQKFPLELQFCTGGYNPGKETDPISEEWFKQWSQSKDCIIVKENYENDRKEQGRYYVPDPIPKERKESFWDMFGLQTVALIAHDEMKSRMVDFAIEYENELAKFGRILATGTTGRDVQEATRKLNNIYRGRSGPKGGDIEIATEILYGRCDVVIFFIDPLNPHPHIEDIRTVFSACMIENEVKILTNEVEAREWMDEVVRPTISKAL